MSNKATKEASVALEPVGKAQLPEAEAATLLGVSRSRIVQLGIGKRIRRRKVGGFWRYARDSILEYKASRISTKTSKSKAVAKPVEHGQLHLTDTQVNSLLKWAYSAEILKTFPISKSSLSAAKVQGQIRHKVEEDGRLMYCVSDVRNWVKSRRQSAPKRALAPTASRKVFNAPKSSSPPLVERASRQKLMIQPDRRTQFISVLRIATEWLDSGVVSVDIRDRVVLDAIAHLFDKDA